MAIDIAPTQRSHKRPGKVVQVPNVDRADEFGWIVRLDDLYLIGTHICWPCLPYEPVYNGTSSTLVPSRTRGATDDQLSRQCDVFGPPLGLLDGFEHQFNRPPPHLAHGNVHGGEPEVRRHLDVVIAHHRQVFGYAPLRLACRFE